MKVVCIIQARIGSSRLPAKVMLSIKGKSVLSHIIQRLKCCQNLDAIVVATSNLRQDQIIANEAKANNVDWYQGSEVNVLSRYFESALKFNADCVVRITSDCPFIDPILVDEMVNIFVSLGNQKKIDYLSNCLNRSFPRGLDAEIFSYNALETAYNHANKTHEREHVTPYIYLNPEKFTLHNFNNQYDLSDMRWTLDTLEDFNFVSEVYERLYKPNHIFSTQDILDLLKNNPDISKINENVLQKELNKGE